MAYEAQQLLPDRGRDTAHLGRTLAGIALVTVITAGLMLLWIFVISGLLFPGSMRPEGPSAGPLGMVLMLSTFLCPLVALAVAMRVLHRKGLGVLMGPAGLAWSQFWRVFLVQCAVLGVALMLPSPEGMEPERQMAVTRWLSWMPLALVLLAVQIGSEELMFRGYLQSRLAARFRSPLLWVGVPAVVFALLHFNPAAGDNLWPILGVTFLYALAAGDLTARAGTLGPVMALHFVNNFGSLMLFGASGGMEGLALYVYPADLSDPALLPGFGLEALLMLISWLGARVVLRR